MNKLDGSERSMIPLIKTDAYLLIKGGRASSVEALEEFSAGTGISDITLFSIDKRILNDRSKLRFAPLTSKVYVEIILFVVSQGNATLEDIASYFNDQYSYITINKYVESLVKMDVLDIDGVEYSTSINTDSLATQEVVAIEAKVRDWKSGVKQAMRYKEYADYSYLAIYESHISRCLDNLDKFDALGLGLIGVSDSGVRVHLKAKKSDVQMVENKILALERFLSIFDNSYQSFEIRNNLSR